MWSLGKRRRSALLVDFDNLIGVYKRPFLDNIDAWLRWLETGQFDPKRLRRKFVARRVYWNTENDAHRQTFLRHGFEVKLCRAIRKEKASSADFDITIDAIELSHQRGRLDEVIILSFDTDFSSVLLHLQLDGRTGVAMIDGDTLDLMRDTPTAKYMRILDLSIGKREFGAVFGATFGEAPLRPAASPPAPVKPAPIRQKPSAVAQAFDFVAAAGKIASAAAHGGLVYIGKERVRGIVNKLAGFKDGRGWPWAGHSYEKFLDEVVRARPQQFEIGKTNNGGVLLVFKGAASSE